MTLDEWSDDEIDAMFEVGGNSAANSIYEAYFPEGYTKPAPDASHEQRAKFIRLFMFSYTQCTVPADLCIILFILKILYL